MKPIILFRSFVMIMFVMIMMTMLTMSVCAAAEFGNPDFVDITDWITGSLIATFAGTVVVVTTLTEVCKNLPFLSDKEIDAKWYALFWSVIVCAGVQFIVKQDATVEGIFLLVLNTFLVYGISVGVIYETVVKPVLNFLGKR